MNTIRIYAIGFTQTSAETFFGKLIKAGVKKIVDARLNNSSPDILGSYHTTIKKLGFVW